MHYATKAQWAAAKAAEYEQLAADVNRAAAAEPYRPGRRRRDRDAFASTLLQATRYRSMAERYAARGL